DRCLSPSAGGRRPRPAEGDRHLRLWLRSQSPSRLAGIECGPCELRPPATPRPCKVCGKLTASAERRPIFGPSTKPKRLCAACASDFDRRRSRRSRAIRFLMLATLAALLAIAALAGASALAFG